MGGCVSMAASRRARRFGGVKVVFWWFGFLVCYWGQSPGLFLEPGPDGCAIPFWRELLSG